MRIVYFEATSFQKYRTCHSPFPARKCSSLGFFPLTFQFKLGKTNQVQNTYRPARESGTPAQVAEFSTLKKQS
jgi:hypothetical protein